MALQKSITLPNTAAGDYIRLGGYRWDRMTREASAHFHLFGSAAAASINPQSPLCLIAVLRLEGAKFDQYLSNAVLEATEATIAGQLYLAARSEPLIAGGGLTAVALADAADV